MGDRLEQVKNLIEAGHADDAFHALQLLSSEAVDIPTANRINQLLDLLLSKHAIEKRLRIVFLRSFTLEPVVPLLRAQLLAHGLCAEVKVAGFNQFEPYLHEAGDSEINQIDLLVLAARLEEVAPEAIYRRLQLGIEGGKNLVLEVAGRIAGWIETFRARSKAKILLHNFAEPKYLSLSIFDAQSEWGQGNIVSAINAELTNICRSHQDVYLLDFNRLQRQIGVNHFYDERLWYLARQPLSRSGLQALAKLYSRYACAMFTPRKKCLVLDLDNTLWGGILGEDGLHGIHLGPDYPDNVFMDFQRAILNLYDRGIILAIASKNNENDVAEVLDKHPHAILKSQHFAVIKANWNPKPQSLREIAAELNIGLDSLVFIDDSPHECELVRQTLPEVLTIQLPSDPLRYIETLDNIWGFDTVTFSDEDRVRGQDYQAQLQRNQLKLKSSSLEDFFLSLQMEVSIVAADDSTIPRVAQLTQKTNQFNLTTKRYSEADIWKMTQDSNYEICGVRVKDKFGDSGIVGVGIVHYKNDTAHIDTLLLSCRVIGRHVEDAVLHHLVSQAKDRSVKFLVGEYIPTAKNSQVERLYEKFGFVQRAGQPGRNLWSVALPDFYVKVPDWIKTVVSLQEI